MDRHLIVIKHENIDQKIVARLLHMNLRYRKTYLKSKTRLKNELSFYRFGSGVTIVAFEDDLINDIEVLQGQLKESGLESKLFKNIPRMNDMSKIIISDLEGFIPIPKDKNKAQIAEELQLLDFEELD